MSRQTVPDEEKRNQLKDLLKRLNYVPDEDNRIAKAKQFMEQRENRLQQNGLMWSLAEETTDLERVLSIEYQVVISFRMVKKTYYKLTWSFRLYAET